MPGVSFLKASKARFPSRTSNPVKESVLESVCVACKPYPPLSFTPAISAQSSVCVCLHLPVCLRLRLSACPSVGWLVGYLSGLVGWLVGWSVGYLSGLVG